MSARAVPSSCFAEFSPQQMRIQFSILAGRILRGQGSAAEIEALSTLEFEWVCREAQFQALLAIWLPK